MTRFGEKAINVRRTNMGTAVDDSLEDSSLSNGNQEVLNTYKRL